MSVVLTLFLFAIGVALIVKGGDFFVDAAAWMAEVSGIPKIIIGATIVSFATTLPELIVSLIAAAEGKVDMAIGNAIGSVTANIGLIMGIAILCMPTVIKRKDYALKTALMLGGALILMLFGFQGEVAFLPGLLLIAIFGVAMFDNVRTARKMMAASPKKEVESEIKIEAKRAAVIWNIAKFVIGAAGIVIGAQLLVDNGSEIARLLGVPERIIGVTIIAVGTSLPELVTMISAIAKKQASLSFGNIIGANIIDLALILPLSSLVAGKALPVAYMSAAIDIPASLIVGAIALIPALIAKKFHRAQGVVLLIVYAVYVVITCVV